MGTFPKKAQKTKNTLPVKLMCPFQHAAQYKPVTHFGERNMSKHTANVPTQAVTHSSHPAIFSFHWPSFSLVLT